MARLGKLADTTNRSAVFRHDIRVRNAFRSLRVTMCKWKVNTLRVGMQSLA